MPEMILDFHTHIFPPRVINDREKFSLLDPCFSLLYSDAKARLASVEDLIRSMDENQINKSVVLNLGWFNHDICVITNDYIIEAVKRYPDRIIGFCSIQPNAGDKCLKELERCIDNGIKGVGEMRPDAQDFDLSDKMLLDPIIDIMIRNNLIFLVHSSEPVGHNYTGKGKITPDKLYGFITNYPDLKVVCAHWGGGLPFYSLMPEVQAALKNTCFDTAATPFLYKPDIFTYIAEIVGSKKILFGSDYPLMSPQRVISQLQSSYLDNNSKIEILSANAMKMLNIR